MRMLRIIPTVLVLSSVALSVATWCQGSSANSETTTLLRRRSPVEIWQEKRMSLAQESPVSITNPVVVQARIYAGLLNPPKPRPVPETQRVAIAASASQARVIENIPRVQATPKKVSANFKVHATSVFTKHPERSMALISEPGKGMSWIRPGDTLGYLRVTQIRKDAVVYAFKDTVGQVAWEPSSMPTSQRPHSEASSPMAMDLPNSSPEPSPLPPASANPLPSRLGTPREQSGRPASPRPRRGGR